MTARGLQLQLRLRLRLRLQDTWQCLDINTHA